MRVYVPVSAGDLIDRITILEIKKANIPDKKKLASIHVELDALNVVRGTFPKLNTRAVQAKEKQLKKQNQALWDIENTVRALEAQKSFGAAFVKAARSVYLTNDKRAKLKHDINVLTGSAIREEKWFTEQ